MKWCARFDALQVGGHDMNTETRDGHADIPCIISSTSPTLDPQRVTLTLEDTAFSQRATGDLSNGTRSTWIKAVDFLHPAHCCSELPCEPSRSSSFLKLTVVLSTAIGCVTTCGYGGAKCED
jgi:hypothetical protein